MNSSTHNNGLAQDAKFKPRANALSNGVATADRWVWLQRFTNARIGIGRSGGSQRTPSVLDFRLAHAAARDAVYSTFDSSKIENRLAEIGVEFTKLASAAENKNTYLLNPDSGRTLGEKSRQELKKLAEKWGKRDIVIIISDGLSAIAAMNNALPTLEPLLEYLDKGGWSCYPIILAPFARVKLQDEIGALLGATHSLILIGERPGLDSPDGLSAYFTYNPQIERTESDRNCISNIRPRGFAPAKAAKKLYLLLEQSRQRRISGTALKDNISASQLED